MAFEITFCCDICGDIGGGDLTRVKSIARAKEAGWSVLRVDGKLKCVCPNCAQRFNGVNALRKKLREN